MIKFRFSNSIFTYSGFSADVGGSVVTSVSDFDSVDVDNLLSHSVAAALLHIDISLLCLLAAMALNLSIIGLDVICFTFTLAPQFL